MMTLRFTCDNNVNVHVLLQRGKLMIFNYFVIKCLTHFLMLVEMVSYRMLLIPVIANISLSNPIQVLMWHSSMFS
jgi:hypothetical protein